ncbi:hypothetical protein H0H92_006604 [Tricholoma furcatifolium]|nr:hypothetical protein H0H92_006604 [Tricholoma furcatifolium]
MDTSSVLQALRRESLDVYNRLHSIEEDAIFVSYVHNFYPNIPLVPNLRCGAWYANPTIASSIPAYFKSTDGHTNNWGFNLRRPNLHLLPLVEKHRSIILVDSTRAGKRIPDALSKTVPIWCAVVNRAIARRYPGPDKRDWDTALYTPAGVVSPQEHHQIELRIDAWATSLFNSSFELPDLPAPLRPFWITPATTTFPATHLHATPTFLPIICISASRQSEDERRPGGFGYIQGSGDDHELWSMGLTPAHYWRHTSALLAATRSELPGVIQTIISSDTMTGVDKMYFIDDDRVSKIAKVNGRLRIGTFDDVERGGWSEYFAYVFLPSPSEAPTPPASENIRSITLPLAPRIKTHIATTLLPRALPFIGAELVHSRAVCIICGNKETAEVGDEGVAVLLAALVVFFNVDGESTVTVTKSPQSSEAALRDEGSVSGVDGVAETNHLEEIRIPDGVDKTCIRTRLEWIIASRPAVNPSRATLKQLNEFFLSGNHIGSRR